MRVKIFKQHLPDDLIAKHPNIKRPDARLMVVHRYSGLIEHKSFVNIQDYFGAGDVFVANDSYLLNNFFYIHHSKSGKKIELTLIKKINIDDYTWEASLSFLRRIKDGTVFQIIGSDLKIEVLGTLSLKTKKVRFINNDLTGDQLMEEIRKHGKMKIEKYIKRPYEKDDVNMLKSVFAKNFGSLIPIVAGLHFDEKIILEMEIKDVSFATLTYNVVDNFKVKTISKTLNGSKTIPEKCYLNNDDIDKINNAFDNKKKVCAIGSTTAVALENMFNVALGRICKNEVLMYKIPIVGSDFKVCNALLTNFYDSSVLPLMVDAGFCGSDLLNRAYKEAIKNKYSLSIYGDSLLIL